MVLLSMTPAIVDVVNQYTVHFKLLEEEDQSLASPQKGNPISHGQLVNIAKSLRGKNINVHLDQLLRGCTLYQAPKQESKPKSAEYEALMARLRKEEEARSYERMLNPSLPQHENTPYAHILNQNTEIAKSQHDDITYAEVNRQVGLIFNVLVTVIACGIAIWIMARYWSTPARLFVSMGGGTLIGVAEVVVYFGYLRRLTEAKSKEKAIKEVKTLQDTWTIEPKKKTTSGNLKSRKATEKSNS